jgi:hypothetical protein
MDRVEKKKEKKCENIKVTRKGSRIDLLFGILKGKIFYDDAVFNLGIRQ